ncbi:hypothetical protein [Mycolicibacterium moriokaense]|nr:hypothetical protein [Mycolicibacterium moriokaense]MCV7040722.1 hypothetical protein [Mycolicibacterium moriokaense]
MRKATAMVGAALVLAAGSLAVSQATGSAQPSEPNVRYVVTADAPLSFDVNYVTSSPADLKAFNADSAAYSARGNFVVPWETSVTLTDPQWAYISVARAGHAMEAPPNAHCEIWVDGQLAVQNTGPTTAFCQLGRW